MMFPATAPTIISTSATEIANRIEISEAASARPIHKAATSQIFSIALPFWAPPRRRLSPTGWGGDYGCRNTKPPGVHTYRRHLNGRSHQPQRRLWGTPSPFDRYIAKKLFLQTRACTHKSRTLTDLAMSALPSEADIRASFRHVCFGPISEMTRLIRIDRCVHARRRLPNITSPSRCRQASNSC
jgi:hypothetical protein